MSLRATKSRGKAMPSSSDRNRAGSGAGARPGAVRCAIYTRKSSEEGLEQDFNSLHAQREACEAYVASQRHEGWTVLPEVYDDGGFSGGSMERPALRQLLQAIDAGKVDVVVVYKVDRLTRSLADFAKIVEVFDAKSVSFVSVTQQFNTTSSMGRLTLNVLLSFAQFEREVTGERIRDKIAASKRKGMWMGGNVPLGYAAHDRSLAIDPDEAATVRQVYDLYRELGNVRLCRSRRTGSGSCRSGGRGPMAGCWAASASRAVRSTSSCRTRSMRATSCTGTSAIAGCTRRSSRRTPGRRCNASSRPRPCGRGGRVRRSRRACSPA